MSQTIAERYLLEEPLGDGPVGSVFRGKAKGPSGFTRAVVVKQLHHQLARSDDFVDTLMTEGSALMAGPHPNVEGIHDLVRDGDEVYLVVDPLDGPTLRAWVESFHATSAPAPWVSLFAIAGQVLRGLHVLHDRPRPLAHGGIDPTSIRLDRSGVPVLTRFGVAAACDAADVGATSLRVSAPEGSLRPSADVFAVGLTIYTILAGTSDTALLPDELRARLMAGKPVDLKLIREDIPPVVMGCVLRALSAHPSARYDSAIAMARAIDMILQTVAETTDGAALAKQIEQRLPKPRARKKPRGLKAEATDQLDLAELQRLSIPDE
ncbi:MAG: protein kinase [Myxococcales bacterium]|nr:protein kinase [Myxococcales bacterium]